MQQKTTNGYIRSAIDFVFDRELSIYSSGLSFNVILAIIPFMMIGFYIASFFPMFTEVFEKFRAFLFENIAAVNPETIENYLSTFMSNYQKLGLIGIVAALYTNYIFLSMFDNIAQKIFGCESRSLISALIVYLLVFLALCMAISLPIVALVLVHYIDSTLSIDIFPVQLFLATYLVFKYIPNRQMDTTNAITSSIISTILIEALRIGFVYYVFYTKAYLTIYGSFATLFLFFLWVSVSSQLFLLCMKFCAYLQNSTETSARGK